MGLSSSSSKSTTDQTQTQTGTTTPQNPDWVTNALADYTGRIGAMGNVDPYSFVAPTSPLQSQAFANAGNLGQWTGNSNAASHIALNAANAGANLMPGAAGYSAAQGGVSTYDPATLGNAREAGATGYSAGRAGPVSVAPTTNASASNANSASMLDNLSSYMNPYTRNVVNSTLADYDQNAGAQQAAAAAQAAKAGAFGGSRYGIEQAQLASDLARGRATTESGLLNQGFNTAAGLSQSDAANRQQTSLFNAQNATNVDLANAGAANQRALSQAGFDAQVGLANNDASNQAAQFGAAAQNNASLANQAADNQFALTQAGYQNDAARYGADANNQNMQNSLQRSDAAAQFGANAQNQMEQFNAQQQDNGLNRQLAAANALNGYGNDYAANTRNDLAMMNDLGTSQRQVEQAYDLAPLAQLQAMGSLFGATPYQIFTGQNVTSNGTVNGTTTSTQTPSLFNQLLAAASAASSFVPK